MQNEDWRHIQETVNMLYLAICQIEATMSDSNKSVTTLTDSFTQLASHTNQVASQIQQLKDPQELETFKQEISRTTGELHSNISASIQAFQFYDRVCQRLEHITGSLEKVSNVVSSEDARNSKTAWSKVQNEIKHSYTMEAERIMFEHIMRGASVKDALEIYRHQFTDVSGTCDEDGDEVELF